MENDNGAVYWITGISGTGKSTLARELAARLRAQGLAVVMLDGDELRTVFSDADIGRQDYGRDGRLVLAMQYARLCRVIARQGLTVVIATISLFREVHAWNREHLPGYFEIYLKVPLEELRRRDPKGLYGRFDAGQIRNLAGLDVPIDEPPAADYVVTFAAPQSMAGVADALMQRLPRGNR